MATDDGLPRCPECGGYLDWLPCWYCSPGAEGEGVADFGCGECLGAGGWWECTRLPHGEEDDDDASDG